MLKTNFYIDYTNKSYKLEFLIIKMSFGLFSWPININ